EHPGGEDRSQTWLGAQDLGVRVPVKMGDQLAFEGVDLAGQFGQDPDQRGDGVCPNASSTAGGAASWSLRRAVWICSAFASMLRCRPARRNAAPIFDWDSARPRAGVGANSRRVPPQGPLATAAGQKSSRRT